MKGNMPRIIPSAIMGLICLLFISMQPAWAESNISDTYKYAWSENAGWHNWKATNGQATAGSTYLVGYVWAERIGWVKLGSTHEGGTYPNTTSTNWGVNRDVATGALSGYAWSENAGWINFNPTNGGVTISTSTNKFEGYAWGERIGWIHFQNDSPEYYVMQEASAPTVTTQTVNNIGTTTATGNGTITALGAPHPAQHGVCWNTTGSPTIAGSKTQEGTASATGGFASSMTGLSAGTTYYVRAYATNMADTSYGDEVQFKTQIVLTMAVSPAGVGATTPAAASTTNLDAGSAQNITATAATGYCFVNWTAFPPGNAFFGNAASASTTVTLTGSATATANFASTYTVTYNGNGSTGGTVPADGNAYQEGDEVTVLDPGSLVKTGYTFNNWNTAAGGSGNSYAAGARFNMPGANVTLYAQWTAIPTRYVCSDGVCGDNEPCHKTLWDAVDKATTGTTLILIAAEDQDGNFSLNANKNLTLQGGWDKFFNNPNSGTTTLYGAPKAPQGKLVFQMLTIKP